MPQGLLRVFSSPSGFILGGYRLTETFVKGDQHEPTQRELGTHSSRKEGDVAIILLDFHDRASSVSVDFRAVPALVGLSLSPTLTSQTVVWWDPVDTCLSAWGFLPTLARISGGPSLDCLLSTRRCHRLPTPFISPSLMVRR